MRSTIFIPESTDHPVELVRSRMVQTPRRWSGILLILQAVGVALLPKCPVCVASYFGVFGGFGVLNWIGSEGLFWVGMSSLGAAIAGLSYLGVRYRNYEVVALGLVGGGLILLGKYHLSSGFLSYLGIAVLISIVLLKRSKFSPIRTS